jgi:hypothetical protein
MFCEKLETIKQKRENTKIRTKHVAARLTQRQMKSHKIEDNKETEFSRNTTMYAEVGKCMFLL